MSVAEQKRALRARIRRCRAQRTSAELEAATQGWAQRAPNVAGLLDISARGPGDGGPVKRDLMSSHPLVLAYSAGATEPNLGAAIRAWHADGVRVAVPRSVAESRLEWVVWEPDLEFSTGNVAPVPEPVGGRLVEVPQEPVVVVMPALAVCESGIRLGQGGGFYDRFVEHLAPGSVTVGAVFEDEVLQAGSVPAEPWDAVLDYVWTPGQLTALG